MTFTEAESSPGSRPVYVPGKLLVPFLETCDMGQVEGPAGLQDGGERHLLE